MLPVSAMSDAANEVRDLLVSRIDDLEDVTHIRIGHPKHTLEEMATNKDKNQLNLFFYHVGYDGYPADGASTDPFYVRLYCLITAVGGKKDGSPSPGENDLRLIGEVMRVLHQQPVISIGKEGNGDIGQLQIVPHPLSLDNLNHIWSTQGDTAYRLSVAYEMALAPVPLAVAADTSPLAADPLVAPWGKMTREPEDQLVGAVSMKPEVAYLDIDMDKVDWTPHICLVEQADGAPKDLHYVFRVQGDIPDKLNLLIAGRENGKVKLFWNVWRRKTDNTIVAWKEDIPDTLAPLEKEIKNEAGASDPFHPGRIDPNHIDTRRIIEVQMPEEIKESQTKTWQALLHAVHEWTHLDPAGGGKMITTRIKSNSVLIHGERS